MDLGGNRAGLFYHYPIKDGLSKLGYEKTQASTVLYRYYEFFFYRSGGRQIEPAIKTFGSDSDMVTHVPVEISKTSQNVLPNASQAKSGPLPLNAYADALWC